jgi:hypothetical protein
MRLITRLMEGSTVSSEAIHQLERLLHDVVEHLKIPGRANQRAAARKLERISILASTLAATVHSVRS